MARVDLAPLSLTEYLNLQTVYETSTNLPQMKKRKFDEKFRILQSPATFLHDLEAARFECELRDTGLAVAFVDIDDFKRFNEKHTESVVDRDLLPRVMQTLEAHTFPRIEGQGANDGTSAVVRGQNRMKLRQRAVSVLCFGGGFRAI